MKMVYARRVLVLVGATMFALFACSSDTDPQAEVDRPRADDPKHGSSEPEPIETRRPALCARDRDDRVRDVFCAAEPPSIRSLRDLQNALGLNPESVNNTQSGVGQSFRLQDYEEGAARRGVEYFTVLGHSTGLSGHRVSPLNPRVITFGNQTMTAFQRGVQKLEAITQDRAGGTMNFYLISFVQACNQSEAGCTPGDLYTPKVEQDWLEVRVEDDEDLANTPSDCRQCHQRARDKPTLLMRELNNPWTHFFEPPIDVMTVEPGLQGIDLMRDYLKAKGDERYGGYALDTVTAIAPFLLESTVGSEQPLFFDAPGIEAERWPYIEGTGYTETPRPSPTWNAAWEAFKRGEQLALPYVEVRVSDLDKQNALSDAYARYREGELSEDELPDLGDIFPDDPMIRAQIGLSTEPGASAVDTMIQACGSCHNDVLDQSLSRARFNINLWQLDPSEIEVAIERIRRSPSEPGVMPPPEARQLEPGGRERLLEYLRGDPLAGEPDPKLVRAATLGMAGGARVRTPRRPP